MCVNEITFDDLKNKIQKFQNKDLYLFLETIIKGTIIIEKSKILINNYKIAFTDGKELEIGIDVEPITKIEVSEYSNTFKLEFGIGEGATLNFDSNS